MCLLVQTETDEGSIKEKMAVAVLPTSLQFAIPCLQNSLFGTPASPSRCIMVKAPAAQPLSVAESDSLNETASPMRPHTRRQLLLVLPVLESFHVLCICQEEEVQEDGCRSRTCGSNRFGFGRNHPASMPGWPAQKFLFFHICLVIHICQTQTEKSEEEASQYSKVKLYNFPRFGPTDSSFLLQQNTKHNHW